MIHIGLVIAKLITVGLGFLIAYQAYRGYRRNQNKPLLYVAAGFLTISIGSVLEGILFDVLHFSLFHAGTLQTSIVALGMLFVLYALYGGRTNMQSPKE